MDASTLYPPNAWWLKSDDVISAVVVRRSNNRESAQVETETSNSRPGAHSTNQPCAQQTQPRVSRPTRQHAAPEGSLVRKTTRRTPSRARSDKLFDMRTPAEVTLALHRQRRREVQQRYRKKWREYTDDLEDSVSQLRQEVQKLKTTLERMSPSRAISESTVWNAVVEYFHLFRCGFKPLAPVSELCRNQSVLCVDHAQTQVQFLKAVMAPDVLSNAGYGLEATLEEWRQVSLHHEDMSVELQRLERGPDNSVVAFMDGVTTITARMLQKALPDIERKENSANWESLAARLVGQQLVIPSTVCFHWDHATRRITSMHYVANMLTPLLKLLDNLEDASSVLSTTLDIHHWSKKARPA